MRNFHSSHTKERVLVAMSGGVDSSVAALLLVEQGFEVIGITMQLWDYSQNETHCDPLAKFDTCCSHDDVADARMVAHKLGIPFYLLDYQEQFKKNVVDYFTDEYLKGKTPNPCVACNTFLKFDLLFEKANRLKCKYIATGHYAVVENDNGIYKLKKALDDKKDQSYFLYSLDQEKLSRILFPLGNLKKDEVRAIAERNGLVNAKKKESMEICFIPNNNYSKFIESRVSQDRIRSGLIKLENGEVVGKHDGIHRFTVGQRKGIGVAQGAPLYVTRIEPETGTVYLGSEESLLRSGFKFLNFHKVRPMATTSDLTVKVRYRARDVELDLREVGSETFALFKEPQKSVSPGQIAVIYQNDEVIAGGFIDETIL